MPGKSEMKRIVHEKIRANAAAAMKREGLSAVSVHRVMHAAGLTVGGFYAHYGSREGMLEDAFTTAAAQRRSAVGKILEGKSGEERLTAFLSAYLSSEHVDDPASGCPWAAVLSELPRADDSLRRTATELLGRAVAGLHPDRRASIATLALGFASLMLMRTVTDEDLRQEIGESARFAVESIARASRKGENE